MSDSEQSPHAQEIDALERNSRKILILQVVACLLAGIASTLQMVRASDDVQSSDPVKAQESFFSEHLLSFVQLLALFIMMWFSWLPPSVSAFCYLCRNRCCCATKTNDHMRGSTIEGSQHPRYLAHGVESPTNAVTYYPPAMNGVQNPDPGFSTPQMANLPPIPASAIEDDSVAILAAQVIPISPVGTSVYTLDADSYIAGAIGAGRSAEFEGTLNAEVRGDPDIVAAALGMGVDGESGATSRTLDDEHFLAVPTWAITTAQLATGQYTSVNAQLTEDDL